MLQITTGKLFIIPSLTLHEASLDLHHPHFSVQDADQGTTGYTDGMLPEDLVYIIS